MKRRVMLALAGAMVLLTCGAMATEGALAPVLVQQPEEPPGLDDFLQRLPPELQELFRRFFEQQPQQVQPRGRLQFPPVQPVEPAEPEEPPAEPEAPPSAPDLFGRGGNFFFGPNFFFFGPTDPGLLERLFPRAPATPELEDLRSEQQRLLEELNRLEQQLAQRRRQLQEGQPEQPEQPPPEQPQPPAQGGIFLGVRVTTVDDAIREKLGLGAEVSGVVIEVIVPGSPAEQAGLQVDDVIVAVDGQAVASAQEFARQVRVHRPGEQVTFAVLRQGAISTITVTLGQSEQPPQQPPAQPPQGRIPLPQQPAPPTSPAPEQPPVPQRPYLGVNGQTIDEQLRMFFNLPEAGGVLVESVEPGSPAEQAGIRGGNITARVAGRQVTVGGDVITAIDRQRVTSLEQLDQMVRSHQIGDQITVTVLRRGRSLDLAVTLGGIADVEPSPPGAPGTPGPRTGLGVPPPQAAPPQESQPQPRAFLGIQGRDITAELTQSFRFPVQSGVLIESVEPGSPAEQAGLRGGNITARFGGEEIRLGGDIIVQLDGQAVTSIAQLDELIAAYRPGDRITLTVLRSNRRVEVQVTLGEAR